MIFLRPDRDGEQVYLDDSRSRAVLIWGKRGSGKSYTSPALGYLKRAYWLWERAIYGIYGSTEFMPMIVL